MELKLIQEGDYLITEDKKAHLPLNGVEPLSDIDLLPPLDEKVKYTKSDLRSALNELQTILWKDFHNFHKVDEIIEQIVNNQKSEQLPTSFVKQKKNKGRWVGKYIYN